MIHGVRRRLQGTNGTGRADYVRASRDRSFSGWAPGRTEEHLPLKVHFDLKERLGLPEAVMTDNTMVFHEPVRPGDVLTTRQILRSVSDEKKTKLGTGRFWVIDVQYTTQRDELVGVESYTGFGYRRDPDGGGARS